VNPNEESEPLLALAPLVGVSYDIDDTVAFAVAFYPVAAAGAEYLYRDAGSQVALRNFTNVTFLEVSPGVAFKIPGTNLSLGAGYRISFVSLDRYLGPEDPSAGTPTFDVEMSGSNFTGFRLGLQWEPIPELQLGFAFRSLTRTEIEDDEGRVLAPATKIKTEFTLPAKMGFGVRANIDPVAIVLDVEYGFYSQNETNTFSATPALVLPIVNVSNWLDAITLRAGVEYVVDNRWFFRGGFLYDGQVSQEDFPSAFGTPPSSTTTITAGVGYKCEDTWKLNFAVAHRFGSTEVNRRTKDSDGNDLPGCIPCSASGDYSLTMTGFYLDFMYAFPDL
jgi:long-subunit fatty acid transport protein